MKTKLLILLVLLCLPSLIKAQDKGDFYYQSHPEEIFSDAKALFPMGNYDRILELCQLHKDMLGDEHAQSAPVDSLRLLTLDCQKLAYQLEKNLEDGHFQAAKGVAEELRKLNPQDERLKQFEQEEQQVVVEQKPTEPEHKKQQPVSEDAVSPYSSNIKTADKTMFPVRLGVGLLDLGGNMAVAPALSFGIYNIGESVFGFGVEAYMSPWLAGNTVSIIGANLTAAIHIPGTPLYPNAGIGFFNCSDKNNSASNRSSFKHSTAGLCYPVGLALVLGGGFTFDLGVSFYPEVKVWQTNTVETAGKNYEIPVATTAIRNPLSVWFSLGWAF